MNESEATDALWGAIQEDREARNPAPAPEPVVPEQVEDASTTESGTGTTSEEDSFTDYGPNDLPPELRPYYDSMLADYRRKTQEIADQRRQFEEIGGYETAREAVEFATLLQTDPNYAYEVYQGLANALEAAGMSPVEAQQEAARQVQEAASSEDSWDETEEWDSGPDLSPLKRELEELKAWRERVEEDRRVESYALELQRQEAAIRQTHPEYMDEDIDDIYALAWEQGGDLMEAERRFRTMQERWLEGYLAQKSSVPTGISAPPATAPADIPEKSMTLDEAHEAAVAKLRTILEEQGS